MEETQECRRQKAPLALQCAFLIIIIITIIITQASKPVRDGAKGKTRGYKTEDETQRWQRHASLFTV